MPSQRESNAAAQDERGGNDYHQSEQEEADASAQDVPSGSETADACDVPRRTLYGIWRQIWMLTRVRRKC